MHKFLANFHEQSWGCTWRYFLPVLYKRRFSEEEKYKTGIMATSSQVTKLESNIDIPERWLSSRQMLCERLLSL